MRLGGSWGRVLILKWYPKISTVFTWLNAAVFIALLDAATIQSQSLLDTQKQCVNS